MNIDLYLLKFLFLYKNFLKYSSFIEKKFLKDNAPELYKLFEALSLWHGKFPGKNVSSIEEFSIFYNTIFPTASQREEESLHSLLSKLNELQVEESVARDFLMSHIQRTRATEASLVALDVAEGRKPFDALQSVLEALEGIPDVGEAQTEFTVLSDDSGFPEMGLRWSLDTLNKSLGSLRKGDNGFLFARPEAGKTTFVISQGVHMTCQLAKRGMGPCIYITNEQSGEIIMQRAVQSLLGLKTEEFFSNKKKHLREFQERTDGKFLVYDRAYVQCAEVDKLCRKYNPSLIIGDQLDKFKGFANNRDREDISLKQIYQWARELAKAYGPFIGVSQASVSAEGKKYLTMDDVDGSKTAKQGEADWILGIGASHQAGLDGIRHFALSKNKLLGDADTDPSRRHGKCDVRINPQLCRFEDI